MDTRHIEAVAHALGACALGAAAFACSGANARSSDGSNHPDASANLAGASEGGGAGSFGSGGDPSTAGAGGVRQSAGGTPTGGGGAAGRTGSGGAGGSPSGTAGQTSNGGTTEKPCYDAQRNWLPEVKACQVDADCTYLQTSTCCGPGPVYGVAKAAQGKYACFDQPPLNCPAGLGCASQPSSEDNQSIGYMLQDAAVRCVDVPGGKACYTTARGACNPNSTRCSAGDTCTNTCGVACSCKDGYVFCEKPSGACVTPMQGVIPSCWYPSAPGATTSSVCTCESNSWICRG